MEVCASAGLYAWYQKVKTKDLGETRLDWLQYLRAQATQSAQSTFPASNQVDNEKIIPLQKEAQSNYQEQDEDSRKDTEPANTEPYTSPQSDITDSLNRHDCESNLSFKMEKTADSISQQQKTITEQCREDMEERRPKMSKEDVSRSCRDDVEKKTGISRDHLEERRPEITSPYPVGVSPHREPTTPFSMFLNRSSPAPSLVLPDGGGNTTPEGSHSSSLYSPTVPVSEIISPGTRCNTTHEVLTSLGSNDSVVSWSSALATPAVEHHHLGHQTHTSPSTIERLTLHPRQGLRQNVLARSLFSPRTPGVHSSCGTVGNESPELGIIQCYSPVPAFSEKTISRTLKSGSSSEDDSGGEPVVCLRNITQGFGVDSGLTNRDNIVETKRISSQDGQITRNVTVDNSEDGKKAGRLEIMSPCGSKCSSSSSNKIDFPAGTSTPIPVHVRRTSLPVRHLAFHSNLLDSPINAEKTDICKKGKREEAILDGDAKENEPAMSDDNVQGDRCSTEILSSQNSSMLFGDPFDLICSPVISSRKEEMGKVKKNSKDPIETDTGRNHQPVQELKDHREQRSVESMDCSLNMSALHDAIRHPKFKAVHGTTNVGDVGWKCNVSGESCPPVSIESETLQIIPLKKNNMQGKQKSQCNENIDKSESEEKCNKNMTDNAEVGLSAEKFCQCNKNRTNLFGRQDASIKMSPLIPSKIFERRKRKPDSLLEKLSLRKKKRLSDTFLYPTSTEKVYDKLNVIYKETLCEVGEGSSFMQEVFEGLSEGCRETFHKDENSEGSRTTKHKSSVVSPRSEVDKPEMKTNVTKHFQAIEKQPGNFLPLSNLKKDEQLSRSSSCMSKTRRTKDKENYEISVATHCPKGEENRTKLCFSSYEENIKSIESVSKENTVNQNFYMGFDRNRSEFDESSYDGKSEFMNMQNKERLRFPEQPSVSTDLWSRTQQGSPVLEESSCAEQLKNCSNSQTQKQGYSQFLNDSLSNIDFSTMDVVDVHVVKKVVCDIEEDSKSIQSANACTDNVVQVREVSHEKSPGGSKNVQEKCNFSGFVTGSGKKMHVNMKSLSHAKKLFEDLPDEVEVCQTEVKQNSLKHNTESSAKEPLEVSDLDRLTKPKISESIYPRTVSDVLCQPNVCTESVNERQNTDPVPNDMDKSILPNGNSLGYVSVPTNLGSIGFLTAQGKKVSVNETALIRARKLWEESSSGVACLKESEVQSSDYCYSTSKGIDSAFTKDSITFIKKRNYSITGPKPVESFKSCKDFDDSSFQRFQVHNEDQENSIAKSFIVISKEVESDLFREISSTSKDEMCLLPEEGLLKKSYDVDYTVEDIGFSSCSTACGNKDFVSKGTLMDTRKVSSDDLPPVGTKMKAVPQHDDTNIVHHSLERCEHITSLDKTEESCKDEYEINEGDRLWLDDATGGIMTRNLFPQNCTGQQSSTSSDSTSKALQQKIKLQKPFDKSCSVEECQTELPRGTLKSNDKHGTAVVVSSPSGFQALSVDSSEKAVCVGYHDLRTSYTRDEVGLTQEAVSRETKAIVSSPSFHHGFLTARGGKIVLQEATVLRAKKLFEDVSCEDNIDPYRKSFHAPAAVHDDCKVNEDNKNGIQTAPVITESVLLKTSNSEFLALGCDVESQSKSSLFLSHFGNSKNTLTECSGTHKVVLPHSADSSSTPTITTTLDSKKGECLIVPTAECEDEINRSPSPVLGSQVKKGKMSVSQSHVQSLLKPQATTQRSSASLVPVSSAGKIERPLTRDVEILVQVPSGKLKLNASDTSYTTYKNGRHPSVIAGSPFNKPSRNVDDSSMNHVLSPKNIRAELKRDRSNLRSDSSQLSNQATSQSPKYGSPLLNQETVRATNQSRSLVVSKHCGTSNINSEWDGIADISPIRDRDIDESRSPVLSKHSGSRSPSSRHNLILKASNTQEVSDITEITKAFLKDDPWEQEETIKPSAGQGKRVWEAALGENEEREAVSPSTSHKSQNTSTDTTPGYFKECLQDADEISASRELLRMKQARVIQHKEKQRQSAAQIIEGVLHRTRREHRGQRLKLHSLGRLQVWPGMRKDVHAVQPNNALQYRFPVQDLRFEVVKCSEGCSVVPGADGCVGVEEVERGFLATPGVHPSLVHPSWVKNHYKWIVWKLAALERHLLHRPVLTLENLVLRLKYRYDREVDRAQRPVLRKVTEQDDIPQKTMVLCVADIKSLGSDIHVEGSKTGPEGHGTILELTDGWYSIGSMIDGAMSRMVESGKVAVGMKLVIHGAELTGSSPHPCHPLEASNSLRLRLHTNLTRRARWWARLGLLPQRGPPHSLLAHALDDGGLVGQLTVLLARIYPIVYFERAGGKATFRGERAHRKMMREMEKQREMTVNQVVADVEEEFNQEAREFACKKRKLATTKEEVSNLTLGQDIAFFLEETVDPSNLESLLTSEQIQLARTWQERQADEKRRRIATEVKHRLAKKQVLYEATPLLKVRVVDKNFSDALVAVWRPTDDLLQALSEGSYYSVQYLMTGGYRMGCQQFTATRQTKWERIPPSFSYDSSRSVTPLCLTSSAELSPLWQEVDLAGVVLRIEQPDNVVPVVVHIIDHHANILTLKLWDSLKESGYEDILIIGTVISIMNGSWRGHREGRFGCVHITELTVISSVPRASHLIEAVTHLKNSVQDMKNLLQEGDMKLDRQFDKRVYLMSSLAMTAVCEKASGNHQRQCTDKETSTCTEAEFAIHKNSVLDTSQPSDKTVGSSKAIMAGNSEVDTVQPNSSGEAKKSNSVEVDDETVVDNEARKASSDPRRRAEQRSQEVRSKLQALGQYGTPSPLRNLKSPATVSARKPFRAPFKQQ